MFSFKISKKDERSCARVGMISTPHGNIHTPAFVPVGTQATVKSLTPDEIRSTGTQMFFVNTYHQYLRPGADIVEMMGGLHRFMNWNGPIITDSGGFQAFSLGRDEAGNLAKITDNGVSFRSHIDGSKHFFTPEKSIMLQKQLGADIILPLDECTSYPTTHEYAKKALNRTHEWAGRSIKQYNKLKIKRQAIYGIVQGGVYEDLRIQSAKYIATLPFHGYAIGGVSVGESKKDMKNVCDWTIHHLRGNKPRHLLGVGEIDDIFEIIERGVDTFDCVMPTRIARMGHILVRSKVSIPRSETDTKSRPQKRYEIDITKKIYNTDNKPLDIECKCFVCKQFTRSYIHHLFRARELLAYRLATYHNVHFIHTLVESIRISIKEDTFAKLKKNWLC